MKDGTDGNDCGASMALKRRDVRRAEGQEAGGKWERISRRISEGRVSILWIVAAGGLGCRTWRRRDGV